MASTIWKGVIRIGEESVPVKLRSAVTDKSIRFRILDEPDGAPVEQKMVNPRTGKAVPYGEIRRGVETESGLFGAQYRTGSFQVEKVGATEERIDPTMKVGNFTLFFSFPLGG